MVLSSLRYLLSSKYTIEIGEKGGTFDTNKRAAGTYDFFEQAERELLSAFLSEARAGDVFYDVGANFGLYSVFVGPEIGSRGRVLAFEPYPPNVDHLQRHAELNNISNISIISEALTDTVGEATFVPPEEMNCGTAGIVDASASEYTVPTTTIDQLVDNGQPAPNMLKIDVEGAEELVLRGMTETLARGTCRFIGCEVHPERMYAFDSTPETIRDLLSSHGYVVEQFARNDQQHIIART